MGILFINIIMRFTFIAAALLAVVAAKQQQDDAQYIDMMEDDDDAPEANPKSHKYMKRVKDPFVKARYKYAIDKCKGGQTEKKRYKCFKRQWNLFKPHRQNNLNDLRARAHRACWRYKNNLLKRAKCFGTYIKDYKGALYKGLLADHEETAQPAPAMAPQKALAEEEEEEDNEQAWPYVPGNTQSSTESE